MPVIMPATMQAEVTGQPLDNFILIKERESSRTYRSMR
jgi:hypothetical protein